jgi:phospholipid/cholesterol/gamma-HCH transport system substrate-binding protein
MSALSGTRLMLATVTAVGLLGTAACDFTGVGSLALPLRQGVGDGSMQVTVDLAEVSNMVPNAEVKVNDVTVGSVVASEATDWHAHLTVALDGATRLPANATARVGQKSLLGAEYLELSAPADQPPIGQLRDGDAIPLSRTGKYPETEDVLAALSVVLNGSGLQQVRTISTELNQALNGHQGDARELLANLRALVGTLDSERVDINTAVDGLARFGTSLAADNQAVAAGLERIPPALRTLNSDRDDLIKSLRSVAHFGNVAVDVIGDTSDDLLANLRSVQPALRKLADSGKNLTDSASMIVTYPFPANTSFPNMFKGDYGNLFAVVDITPSVLARNLLTGFQLPLPGNQPLLKASPLGAGQQVRSPLTPFLNQNGTNPPSRPPSSSSGPDGGLVTSLLPGGN